MQTDAILYLNGNEVAQALQAVDPVEAVTAALVAHARGQTTLPAEAYLAWSHAGEALRSLSMPGMLEGRAGVKIINANPDNPSRGLPRASGLTILFDVQTGRPLCLMEAARISCLRTAAVTAIAAELLGAHPLERIAILGAGSLAQCHLDLLPSRLPQLREVRLYDLDRARASSVAATSKAAPVVVCDSAEQAISGAQLVVPVTTATSGYIPHAWLAPGTLLVNISLDDPLPEVVLRADKVFVDDWPLVAADEHRLLGRMLRAGQIRGPSNSDPRPTASARPVDAELGQLLTGARPGRSRPDEIILVNPFGLAIEDLALADRVYRHASEFGLGTALAR